MISLTFAKNTTKCKYFKYMIKRLNHCLLLWLTCSRFYQIDSTKYPCKTGQSCSLRTTSSVTRSHLGLLVWGEERWEDDTGMEMKKSNRLVVDVNTTKMQLRRGKILLLGHNLFINQLHLCPRKIKSWFKTCPCNFY